MDAQALAPFYGLRTAALTGLGLLPPFLAAALLAVAIGAGSIRLGLLVALCSSVLAGQASLQFQGRHVFQLEVLPLWIYGCAISGAFQIVRSRWSAPSTSPRWSVPTLAIRVVALTVALAAAVTVPVFATRRYQTYRVAELLSSYEAAGTEPVDTTVAASADRRRVLLRTPLGGAEGTSAYVDSGMLVVDLGGDRCDYDAVSLTFHYRAMPPATDLSAERTVAVPPIGQGTTRVLFPVFTPGSKTISPQTSFEGLELPPDQQDCVVRVQRFARPSSFPLLLEATLPATWKKDRLYETVRGIERENTEWVYENLSVPEGERVGRRMLEHLEPVVAAPTFRSPLVKRLTDTEIDIIGTPKTSADYLLTWPYEQRRRGAGFFVECEILEGGLTIALQQQDKWVRHINLYRPGRFRIVLRLDDDGRYGPIVTNHLIHGPHNHATITRYGWLAPAEPQPTPAPTIQP